jgi:hypothetical protein
MDDEAVYHSAFIGLAEMVLSGCCQHRPPLHVPQRQQPGCHHPGSRRPGDPVPSTAVPGLGQSAGSLPGSATIGAEDAIWPTANGSSSATTIPNPIPCCGSVWHRARPSRSPAISCETAALARSMKVYLHTTSPRPGMRSASAWRSSASGRRVHAPAGLGRAGRLVGPCHLAG